MASPRSRGRVVRAPHDQPGPAAARDGCTGRRLGHAVVARPRTRAAQRVFARSGDLFARALRELGRPVPSPARARWLFIHYLCWLVVTDQVSPLDGGKRLERIHYWEPPEAVELGHISGLVDEWEGQWGRRRPAVETELRRAAQELLERPYPTDWVAAPFAGRSVRAQWRRRRSLCLDAALAMASHRASRAMLRIAYRRTRRSTAGQRAAQQAKRFDGRLTHSNA